MADEKKKEEAKDAGAGKGDLYRRCVARKQYDSFYTAKCKTQGHKFNGRRCRNCGFIKAIDWE